MLSCAKAAEYLNLREEKALSFKQNLQLNIHLLACKTCKAFASQSETIKKMFRQHQSEATSETQNKNLPLIESIKGKIEKL
jgi:hypothetical protein